MTIVLILIGIIFLLSATLSVLIGFYVRLLNEVQEDKKDIERLKDTMHHKAELLVSQAKDQADEIVREANAKSQNILAATPEFINKARDEMQQTLSLLAKEEIGLFEKDAKELLEIYRTTLSATKTQAVGSLSNVMKDIDTEAQTLLQDFKGKLGEATTSSQKVLSDKILAEFQSAHDEVEKYKKGQIEKVNNSLLQTLMTLSKEVLGKTINSQEQENLIMQALEQAKLEEGSFS